MVPSALGTVIASPVNVQNKKAAFAIVATGILCLASTCNVAREPKNDANSLRSNANSLRNNVEAGTRPQFVDDDTSWDTTRQLYTLRQFEPAWSNADGISASADSALKVLENASAEGLNPQDFGVDELRAMRESFKTAKPPNETPRPSQDEFELRLSYSLMRYVSQLCFGRINPADVLPEWPKPEKTCEVVQIVQDALASNGVENLAEHLSPKLQEYAALKAALSRYREIAAQGGWQSLSTPTTKKPSAAFVSMLQARLAITADPDLKAFQTRHGLKPDGRIGPKTIDALNVPVDQRIAQIEINLDRMRWIADRFEPQHIRVNIPGFELTVHDADQVPLQMRAIVGSQENATPILDGVMEYLVFSPYWNIPLSIATKELLPKIQGNRKYLERENIEVVRGSGAKAEVIDPSKINWHKESELSVYQLRQKPGTMNALGLVKFIFPNSYNIYLHDTPSGNLFDRLTRTLSHGCIRVEHPKELATYLLRDQPEWTPEAIDEAMHAGMEKRANLKTRIPVHLFYWTAWVDTDGNAQFREDVYGYDEKHWELTKGALPAPNATNIDVDKVGTGIVPDTAGLHGQSGLSKQ